MRTCIVTVLLVLTITGCARLERVGGPYYLRREEHWHGWEPPSGSTWHFIYKDGGLNVEITDRAGMTGGSTYRQFTHGIYGRNLAYIEFDRGYRLRLFVYSERHGRILVDPAYSSYWKVIADDTGITCHRYQEGRESDDPTPVVYGAAYLAEL